MFHWTETFNSQLLNSATVCFTISTYRQYVHVQNECARHQEQIVCMLVGKHPQTEKHVRSHLTACRTLLSRGLRLGSLVDERMPVPQLLARVFLIHQNTKELHRGGRGKTKIVALMPADKKKYINFYIQTKLSHETVAEIDPDTQTEGTNLSKKAASSLLSSTLCLVPALTWQFISWARDIYTEVPAKISCKQMIHQTSQWLIHCLPLWHVWPVPVQILSVIYYHILDFLEWSICLSSDDSDS